MSSEDLSSLHRRLTFSSLFSAFLTKKLKPYFTNELLYRGLSSLAQLVYDSIESIRRRSFVGAFGSPNICALEAQSKIDQHPSSRCYYHDAHVNSTVGMHLGVDLIPHKGTFYPIDVNLVAAIRQERRDLYSSKYDPLLSRIVDFAFQNRYAKILCIADWWTPLYVDETVSLNNEPSTIDLKLASPNPHNNPSIIHWAAFPDELEPDTLYVVFNHPHTPVDYFLTNQSYAASGLRQEYEKDKSKYSLLGFVDSSDDLPSLNIDLASDFPNLVIKLGGSSSGRHVRIARVDREFLARSRFDGGDIVSIFGLSLFTRLKNWIGQHNQLVFQQLIPADPVNGHAQIYRTHILVTPERNFFLSAHRIVSDHPLPSEVPTGVLDSDSCYVVNYSKGAHYERLSVIEESVVEEASMQLAQLINSALRERFVVAK